MNDREQPTEADSRGAAWMKWMLDTDTCLAIIKRGSGSAIKKLRGKSIGQVGMSAISLGGFLLERLGALAARRLSKRLRSLSSLLRSAFDGDAASRYGSARASLAKRGTPIGPLDTLIGVPALKLDLILVTHNIRQFSKIEGLRLEDWVD
jgi:tRNA(fMet)-specific endonuclease VapC